jgi:WD40 repeat protein
MNPIRLAAVVSALALFLAGVTALPGPELRADGAASPGDWEYRSVTFGTDEKENTKKLNDLAAAGWEYVGPLTGGMVAFKRRRAGEDKATELRTLEGHTGNVSMVSFSPDGDTLASSSEDGSAILWDWKNGTVRHTFKGHDGGVLLTAFSPDGTTLATPGRDKVVILWAVAKGEKRTTLDDHTATVSSAVWSPDGKWMASACDDGVVKLRDGDGKERFTVEGHKHQAIALLFSRDSKVLVSAGGDWNDTEKGGEVKAWDVQTRKELWSVPGDFGGIWGVAFAPDGKTLAGACLDGTVRLWDPATGKEQAVLKGHTDRTIWVAYSPSGRTLASTSSDGTVRLWDTKTGKEKAALKHGSALQRCSFSPDGTVLAVGCNDNTVRLWQMGR